jgi:hypothetical protein
MSIFISNTFNEILKLQIKRRNKPDLVIKFVYCLNILSWISFIAALVMFHYARPELEYGIVKYFDLSVRTNWLGQAKNILLLLLYCCSGLSALGIILGKIRSRRKYDSQRYNLISLLLVCISFILVLLF